MKKILVLVAGESNLPFIKAAKQLGLYIITCDNNKSNPGHKIADENLFIDVYDYESIINAIKDENIDAVMSFVSSHGLNSASKISEYYNLPGYNQNSLNTLINKGFFRDFLIKNNLNSPKYQYVHTLEAVDYSHITYPVIIKPTDSGGSQGVIKIGNKEELLLNFQISKELSNSGNVIIEEFIEGESIINGDCLVYNGEIIGSMIGNYIYDNKVNKVLPISTVFPAKHGVAESLKQLSDIVKALKIPNGIINFEAIIKNNNPYIVEVNPRPSGNYIWKLMGYKYSLDIPIFLINIYLNNKFYNNNLSELNNHGYAYQLVYSDKNNLFKGFEIPLKLKRNVLDMKLFYKENESINSFKNLYDRIGVLLLEFLDEKQRDYYINNTKLFKLK